MLESKVLDSDHARIEVTAEFIQKSKFSLEKTQDEIRAKMGAADGMFDFTSEVLEHYIDYEHIKDLLTDEAKEKYGSGKKEWIVITNIEETVQDFLDYMQFAWGKAEDERGISASRSVSKLRAWMWLLGRQDLVYILNDDDLYNPYGAPALIKCCEELCIVVPESLREFAKQPC